MITVFTAYSSSEEYFYRDCIASQREYCKHMNYQYIELIDIDINETSVWKPIKILESLVLQYLNQTIAFIKPSVMIMNMQFSLGQFTLLPGNMLVTRHGDKMIDSIIILNCKKQLAQLIDFALKFKDEPTSTDFAYQLISTVSKETLKTTKPRYLVSTWYTHDVAEIKLEVDSSVNFPVVSGDFSGIDHMNSPETIYRVGDFAIDLGCDKHHAKYLSLQFEALRKKIADKYQEAKNIIGDANKYRRE